MVCVEKDMNVCLRHTIVLLAVVFAAACSAQTRKVQNKPYIDNRTFHYGFLCALHIQTVGLETNGYIDPETGEQWSGVGDRTNLGFSVGVVGEWRLNKYFALRTTPTIHFGQRHVTFREQTSQRTYSESMKTAVISVPVDVKFSALRFNNHRPYLLAGINPSYDMTGHKQDAVLTKPLVVYGEVGMGCDFYMPFFKFIPEIKFCFGLNNLLDRNRSALIDKTKEIYTQSLGAVKSNMVMLTFYFE
jgi:hypothetical protein